MTSDLQPQETFPPSTDQVPCPSASSAGDSPVPKISVVIPLYNKEKSISRTVDSVLSQTFTNFELIIVNDGSTDKSLSVVSEITDSRIQVIDKPNGGVSSARNRGISAARGEWIALLDGDDLWLPEHLENFAKAFALFPSVKVFYSGYTTDKEKNFKPFFGEFAVVVKDYFSLALAGHGIWSSCVCFHRSLLQKMMMFREDLKKGEDIELWRRFVMSERIVFIQRVTALYNLRGENRACLSCVDLRSRYIWFLPLEDMKGAEFKYFSKMYLVVLKQMLPLDFASFCLLILRKGIFQTLRAFFVIVLSLLKRSE